MTTCSEMKPEITIQNYSITIDRGSRGFGLSLIYCGSDKYPKEERGIFVAKVIPEGQAERSGLLEGDKIITINGKAPGNVDNAVDTIKGSRDQIKLIIARKENIIQNNNEQTEKFDDMINLHPSTIVLRNNIL